MTEENQQEVNKETEKQKEDSAAPSVQEPKTEDDFGIKTEDMIQAGLYFGHRTSRLHPKMLPYIAGVKNTVHIIDLEKTAQKLKEALRFIQELVSKNKVLLFVGTKIQVKDLVKKTAEECGMPYVNERWLGGTITNFETLKKRIEYFKGLGAKMASGELEKYTKKEKIRINQELERLRKKFEGIKGLNGLPDAVFVLDIKRDGLAAKEALMKGIKIIAICHTNTDPTLADYPIPANDDAISSVNYILEKVKEMILKAKPKTC